MTIHVNESNLDFKDLVDQPVYTSDNVYLGKISSIIKNNMAVKYYENDNHSYWFTTDMIDKNDGKSLWLKITFDESNQHTFDPSLGIKNDAQAKTNYETVTFRINENVMAAIRTEADNSELSLNNFANYILDKYVKEYKFENDMGIAYINKPVVIELFNKKTDDEVIKIAKQSAKKAIYNRVLFSDGRVNLESFINWISDEMSKYYFGFKHLKSINKNTYIIWHGIGHNFSLYYKTILEEFFHDHLKKPITFIMSDDLLVFEIDL
jgi:hypothetical protein